PAGVPADWFTAFPSQRSLQITDATGRRLVLPSLHHSMVLDKVRIRFRKTGNLRLVSHHDLMRSFERMLRRAALPYRRTQGFHPKPRLVFALSLPRGVVGREEVVELDLEEILAPQAIHDRLASQAPVGLEITSVRRIDPRTTAHPSVICYRVALAGTRSNE